MVAMTMHLSAVIFVIPIVIYIFRKHRFIHWIVIGGVLFVTLFYNQMLKLMSSIFPRYSHITANDNQYMNAGFSAIVWIIVFVISIMILKKNKKYQLKESIFAVCAIFYPLFSCLGLAVNYFERLGFYFIPFVPVVLDSFGKKEFTSNRILYRAVVCLFFGVWFLIACKNYPYEITNLFGGV